MNDLGVNAAEWKLLSTSGDLLLALRHRRDGVLGDLSELAPRGAVLAGDMSEMLPSDLLNFLHQGRRTGVLLARSDGVERGIVLVDGNVAWACSTSPGERLGELLGRMGVAPREKIEEALKGHAASGGKKRVGEVLVERGILSAEDVRKGLRHQVVEIFLGLLVARAGAFVFLRDIAVDRLPAQMQLDTQGLLLDGLRRLDEMELYRSLVAGPDAVPRFTGKSARTGALTPEERQILALVDGARSVGAMGILSALGEFEATKAVYKLVEAGYLKV